MLEAPLPKNRSSDGQESEKENRSSRIHESRRERITCALKSTNASRQDREVDEAHRRLITPEGPKTWNQVGPSSVVGPSAMKAKLRSFVSASRWQVERAAFFWRKSNFTKQANKKRYVAGFKIVEPVTHNQRSGYLDKEPVGTG